MEFLKQISVWSTLKFLFDFSIIWMLIYGIMRLLRNNDRAAQIFKGLLILIFARYVVNLIGLKLTSRILAEFLNWGVLLVVIIFSPEIRNALENVGKKSFFNKNIKLLEKDKNVLIHELVSAVTELSNSNTGALITIEMKDSLKEYYTNGILVDAKVTKALLGNIFYPKTPLHDGAVIIQGDKIMAASVFFLPTTKHVQSKYGARHRAALGISEVSDSLTIVVSEETGDVSVAVYGKIHKMTIAQLEDYLIKALETETKKDNVGVIRHYLENPIEVNHHDKFTKTEMVDGELVNIYYRPFGGKK